ncbi:MAG: bifunctional diguanylate cyclase/phosphodiesterase [Peptostreptococcaceae bacterium]|nr:bifunctional diguanylate cyclase/phosphodiesterase [Peptostreptococcaceae bacterium]
MWKSYIQKFKLNSKYTVTSIVSVCFLLMLLLQSVIFSVNFSLLRTDEKLNRNTYSYILQKADDASKQIEHSMTDLWSNKEYMSQLESALHKMQRSSDSPTLDADLGRKMIDMLDLMKASGAFVAFNEKSKNNIRQVLHLKDANENIRFSNNSDISMKVGSDKIAEELGISLESSWQPYEKLDLSETGPSIYNTILLYAKLQNANEYKNHGFWLSPIEDFGVRERSIYYIQPIYNNRTDELFCVIGIEISQSIIDNLLQYAHLSDSDKTAYLLISDQDQSQSGIHWHVITSKGPYIQRLIKNSTLSASMIYNKYYDPNSKVQDAKYLYQLHTDNNEKLIAIPRPVRLAVKDLQQDSTRWYLMAVVDKKEIERYSQELKNSFMEMILLSLFIGIILIYLVSRIITYPLIMLSDRIKHFNDHEHLKEVDRLNIVEIDNLIETIEDLSGRLVKSSKKFQRIVESASVPLVAIEVDRANDTVYRLGSLSSIFPEYATDECFEEKMTIDEYREWKFNFLENCELVETSNSLATDSQILIFKKIHGEQTRYVKIISKRIEHYEPQDNSFSFFDAQREVVLQIIMDHTKEMEERIKIQNERDFDILTGLLNRLSFQNSVQSFIDQDPSHNKKAAMIMWDLDNLKYVNDTYGHDRGDEYLQLAGKALSTLKTDNTYVARVSGDEFFVFMEYDGDKENIRKTVAQIKEQLFESTLDISSSTKVKVRATTGLTWYPEDATKYDELKKFADFAMYTAKHSSKGSICEFNRSLYDKNYILFSGKESLNEFIEKRQSRFAFQPIIDLQDGSVYGYEALLRSTSDQILNIGDVMRLAKAQSRLHDIEILTFEGALEAFDQKLADFEDKYLFINSIASVSLPSNLRASLIERYHNILDKVVIEIIESEDLDSDAMDVKQQMKKDHRCRIAIDDFGTGYATESRLLQVDPDFIKIDMGLIRNIHQDVERQTIVSNILRYTQEKNVKVIAEGVETKEELEKLIELGVDFVQGYYLARPGFEICSLSPEKVQEILQIRGIHQDRAGHRSIPGYFL